MQLAPVVCNWLAPVLLTFAGFWGLGLASAADPPDAPRPALPATEDQAPPVTLWPSECIDCPERVDDYTLGVDDAGSPHVLYGGDHLYHAWHDGSMWRHAVVDAASNVGATPSLAFDTNGNAHAGYCDSAQARMKYAYQAGGEWHTEPVSRPRDGCGGVLVLDAADRPHFLYFRDDPADLLPTKLIHATRTGATWIEETIAEAHSLIPWSMSAVTDRAGRIHVVFASAGLQYAHQTGAGWAIETVDEAPGFLSLTSLAVDGDFLPHIAAHWRIGGHLYYTELRYYTFNANRWNIQTVVQGADSASLTVDANGRPHIAYDKYDLIYAVLNDSTWETSTVAATGSYPVLVLDSQERAQLLYATRPRGDFVDLFVAARPSADWTSEQIAQSVVAGAYNALVLDSMGSPHVSYVARADDEYLVYASLHAGKWTTQRVYTATTGITAMALDAADRPQITFFQYRGFTSDVDLKYATWDGTGWQIEPIEVNVVLAAGNALALDAAGTPHVVYGDLRNLKYARRVGGTWQIQIVDSSSEIQTMYGVALVLDSAGRPHISYFASGGLRYARWTGSAWEIQLVRPLEWSQGITSLALDASEHPVIGFCWFGPGFARWTGAAWEFVDLLEPTTETVCMDPSMALDQEDHPHFSYVTAESVNQDGPMWLRYARWANGGWETWLLQGVGNRERGRAWSRGRTSLALGAEDRPYIAYADEHTGDARFVYGNRCTAVDCRYVHLPQVFGTGSTDGALSSGD